MNVIEPSVTLIEEPNLLRKIELCGRVSYKSEDKITEGSAEKFIKALITHGHESPLEHSNLCVSVTDPDIIQCVCAEVAYSVTEAVPIYLRCHATGTNQYEISGNVRAWRNLIRTAHYPQTRLLADALILAPFCKSILFDFEPYGPETCNESDYNEQLKNIQIINYIPDKKHNILTFRFVCSRAVSHELVRHRLMAVTQESQRYVDESDLKVIRPTWMNNDYEIKTAVMRTQWTKGNISSESMYKAMLAAGAQKQQARDVLTNACKTEVVMTGTIPMWEHFFELRCDKAAYPEIRVLAEQAKAIVEKERERTQDWTVLE